MKISPVCEQRALRIYAIARAGKTVPRKYRARLITDERSIDVPVIKAGDEEHVAIILPANSTKADSRVDVLERHTGNIAACVDIKKAEFLTKVSRHVPEEFSLLGFIDTIDSQNPLHRWQYDLNLDDCFDTLDGDVVWRIAVDWRGSEKSKPRLELIGNDLKRLSVDIHEFEFQKGLLREGLEVSRLIITFRIPRHLTDFCLFAHDPQREVTSNFYPMEAPAAISVTEEGLSRTKSIGEQQDVYASWAMAQAHELANSEPTGSASERMLHVVVFDEDGSSDKLTRTLESLEEQHFENWKATVVSRRPLSMDISDSRIELSHVALASLMPNALGQTARETQAERICIIPSGDVFSPGAFHAVDKASDDPTSVVFFDEDSVDAEGAHSHPRLKGPLNKQLQYTENWVGYGAFFPTELVADAAPDNAESPSLAAYSLSLKAIERKLPFEHVPYVLLSAPLKSPEGQTTIDGTFQPSETGIAKEALLDHLYAIGAHSSVEDGLLDGTLKISLNEMSHPGKVSIVIPTMDHANMLERCVSSLLDKATYQNVEIVLVENNSKESETFVLYDRLQKENPGVVKVVEWEGAFNYSAIINFGAAASTGEFLLFLNNDTEVIVPGFIEEMLALATIPEVGVVGAKLYFKDMLVQHAGMIIGPYGGISHANQNFSDIRPGYQNRALTQCSFSSVTGACQMVRREVFDEVGGYDDTFVVGFNDADFCLKVRAAGYDVAFTPYAELYHYEFVSRGREAIGDEKQTRWKRERDAFFEKWRSELKSGDPLTSSNFDKDNWYYALSS